MPWPRLRRWFAVQSRAVQPTSARARRSKASLACALLLALAAVARAAPAPPFGFSRSLALGHPPRATRVTLSVAPDGSLAIAAGHAHARLPLAEPQRVDVESIALAGGSALALLRVSAAGGREIGVLLGRDARGAARVVWTGDLELHGDPGERTADAIEVRDLDGDGKPEVVVGELDERARVCGQPRSLLRPRLLEPSSLALQPIEPARLAPPEVATDEAVELSAAAHSPGPAGAPLFRALRLVGVSSQLSGSTLGALTDGDSATYWRVGNPAGSAGEFATFHRDAGGLPLRALAITPLPRGLDSSAGASVARTLWLAGEDGARVRVRLPDAPEAGRRYFVVPAKPWPWHCLSVIVAESAPVVAGKPGPTVLAEVEGYTELDFGGGLDQLVKDLGGSGPESGEAAHLLVALGPQVAAKLREAWPKLSAQGRRRAVPVLAAWAEREAAARDALAAALDDGDAGVSKAAFEALLAAGPNARAVLRPRIAKADARGDATALALARKAPAESLDALLAALAADGGSTRAALHQAISEACQAGGDAAVTAVRAWCQGASAGVTQQAVVALALSRLKQPASARALAAELLASAAPHAELFEDRWRLVAAARALPSSPAVDAWLAALAKDEPRWMLRAAAIQALAERAAAQRTAVASAALESDPYPRVRAAASAALAKDPGSLALLAKHAGRDSWPLVRAAAVDALASQAQGEKALRQSVMDKAHRVRAAALRALAKAGARDAWALVEQRLNDPNEWVEVKTEGVKLAEALCIQQSADALLGLLRKGIRPDAWAPEADLALLAFEALGNLGGEAARKAVALASSPEAPAAFKTAVHTQATRKPACGTAR